MGVQFSKKVFSDNFDGSWMKYFDIVSTYESAVLLAKTLWIIDDIFWINMMSWHDIWVNFWRWKIVMKVWVNMFELFFNDQVIICVLVEFFFLYLIIFLCLVLVYQ